MFKKAVSRYLILGVVLFFALMGFTGSVYPDDKVNILMVHKGNHKPYMMAMDGFKEELAGKGVSAEYNYIDLKEQKANVDSDQINFIVALGSDAVKYAKDNYSDRPIVFTMVLNPVESNVVKNIDSPGENITGVMLNIDILRSIELLKNILPNIDSVGMLYDKNKKSWLRAEVEYAAMQSDVKLHAAGIDDRKQINKQLTYVLRKSDCLWAWVDPLVYSKQTLREILMKTLKQKVPFITFSSAYVKAGALLSFECDYTEIGKQTSLVMYEVIKGKDPGSIPVRGPDTIKIAVNKRTAETIGIKFPKEYLETAVVYGE